MPWKDSNEEERLDVGNGILLSPNIDALFDRNIISFSNEGNILISQQLNEEDYKNLGISKNSQLRKVYKDMFKYLERHRKLFYDKEEWNKYYEYGEKKTGVICDDKW